MDLDCFYELEERLILKPIAQCKSLFDHLFKDNNIQFLEHGLIFFDDILERLWKSGVLRMWKIQTSAGMDHLATVN